MNSLNNKQIVLGISGGIGAYKSAELVRLLTQAGAKLRIVLTENGERFISPLTLETFSGHPIYKAHDDFNDNGEMPHIELARWADAILIAPASANVIAKLNAGISDDLLTTLCLASGKPLAIAPAMNQQMWMNPATQANVTTLKERGAHILGPTSGIQACGDNGPGRLLEPADILNVLPLIWQAQNLKGINVLITAGPTQEPIDPVRYLSNHSSGKMGYALATAARNAGANVTLISGPTALNIPYGINFTRVTTAQEMQAVVMKHIHEQAVFIACAAVSDYAVTKISPQKIKSSEQTLTLTLHKNPDIVSEVSKLTNKPFVVGFAAETNNLETNAREKLLRKNLDMIVANEISEDNHVFGSEYNAVQILTRANQFTLTKNRKEVIAIEIINQIANILPELAIA